jgi:hypothetical protein
MKDNKQRLFEMMGYVDSSFYYDYEAGNPEFHKDASNNDLSEAYDDVSMDYIKNKKKADDYLNYTNKKIIDNNIYLNFKESDDWFLFGSVLVFDELDGTEIANASYGKQYENSLMRASIDVRGDKRRLGIGSNIYEWIEELTHEKLYPDTPHSKAAENFWANPKRNFGYNK